MLNRLEMLRIFITAAETRSFKEAATRLGISPQAVTRAVQELEQLHGEMMFHRNTRGIRITSYGASLAERAKLSVQQMDTLFHSGSGLDAHEPTGVVRVTAPVMLGRQMLMPVIKELSARLPQVRVELHLSDAHADVVDERIDIGVRLGSLRDSRFVARRVTPIGFHVVGSPALIARCGIPTQVEQLQELPTTALLDSTAGKAWPWYFAGGVQIAPNAPHFSTNDSDAECEAILAGLGFGQIPSFLADAHIASGRLIPVLQSFQPDPWDVYVYRPQRGPVPPRIRLVFDRCVEVLGAA
ncbi:DNA-binding transcriptional LysR family regulator [Herbaspirillum sp. Sphag1AN]|uniref:LysR family transcriptional regulator n=1 Tax=unclassified Herbaspirillum TaxID=2624150 RepID=UPI00161100BD|nr:MULTISPECIES: LysR family transcriptional regulator [unclassified Herbaspirillum]MBB3214706.1 DNA-binding transcriptional LysR family regulator [Herbaspirillum sp. Sphag1AN]MBB3247891.1 DNA-binding transcriptional LysR family regulator [Herbaspirillum sp. Sphag64]